HTYYSLNYHSICGIKNKENLIQKTFQDRLYKYIGGIVRNKGGIMIAIGGIPNHVHVLLKSKPSLSISDLVRFLKCNSAKWLNDNFQLEFPFSWQVGYGAMSLS
ncbi:MAG: IS200/IS605 family transposase, partial [Cyclobacteriaceae bacterium]|nr:IS200/IS605 family transposase [Cyclobacteriaceae bacterium]